MSYKLRHKDKNTNARLGRLITPHGEVDTPYFMPVGTQASVKTLSNQELIDSGVSMILSNAYHLYLRPGLDIIKSAGGLHKFMAWSGPILSDSGGYQIFSLATLNKVLDEGIQFQSHIDGYRHFLSPEDVIGIQEVLGSDISMVLDECVGYPASLGEAKESVERTVKWAKRSKSVFGSQFSVIDEHRRLLFGIVQGSTYLDLRKECVQQLTEIDFDGYALGGVSVGEPEDLIREVVEYTTPILPSDKVRYLMGVGTPTDIIHAVSMGIDLFDCVVPTRYGRTGTVFTREGKIILRNAEFSKDNSAIDKDCNCPVCKEYSRAYIRHLFNVNEILGLKLASLHNVYFYMQLLEGVRNAIKADEFGLFKEKFLKSQCVSLKAS